MDEVTVVLSRLPRLAGVLLETLEQQGLPGELQRLLWRYLEPRLSHYVKASPSGVSGLTRADPECDALFVLPDGQLLFSAVDNVVIPVPSVACVKALQDELDEGSTVLVDAATGKWYLLSEDMTEICTWEEAEVAWYTITLLRLFGEGQVLQVDVHADKVFCLCRVSDELQLWSQGFDRHSVRQGVSFPQAPVDQVGAWLLWGVLVEAGTGNVIWPSAQTGKKLSSGMRFAASMNLVFEKELSRFACGIYVCDLESNAMYPMLGTDGDSMAIFYGTENFLFYLDQNKCLHIQRVACAQVYVAVYQHGRVGSRAEPLLRNN